MNETFVAQVDGFSGQSNVNNESVSFRMIRYVDQFIMMMIFLFSMLKRNLC